MPPSIFEPYSSISALPRHVFTRHFRLRIAKFKFATCIQFRLLYIVIVANGYGYTQGPFGCPGELLWLPRGIVLVGQGNSRELGNQYTAGESREHRQSTIWSLCERHLLDRSPNIRAIAPSQIGAI